MHPALNSIVLTLFLTACTSQEDFAQSNAEATCDLYADCEVLGVMGDFDDIATCTESIAAELSPEGSECPEYVRNQNRDCLEGILLMTCDDLYDGYWPEACDATCP